MSDNSSDSTLYQYEHVPVSEVSKQIDRFIIPELQNACRSLWQRNIFTFMCSNQEDGKNKYIVLSDLSQENEDIFKRLMESDPDHYTYSSYRDAYSIHFESNNVSEIISEFTRLIGPFKIQDVLGEGYKSLEDFLAQNCGLGKYIPNPNYNLNAEMPKFEDFEDPTEFISKLNEYTNSLDLSKEILVFDETKLEKPIEEYLKEKGVLHLYDKERGLVYDNSYYMERHQKYLEYIKNQDAPSGDDLEI